MSVPYTEFHYSGPGPENQDSAEIASRLLDILARQEHIARICDLGSGNGWLASRLAAAGYAVVGVDASTSGTQQARRHHAGERAQFVQAMLSRQAIAQDEALRTPFDAVVSSDVVEHLYRPADLLELAAAVLRPGGRLLLGTPYHGYLKNVAIALAGKWDAHHGVDWDGGHVKFFSVRTLGALVSRHGFGQLRFHRFGRAPGLWKHMICVATRL
jgi:SAM-dependent methyltransferase